MLDKAQFKQTAQLSVLSLMGNAEGHDSITMNPGNELDTLHCVHVISSLFTDAAVNISAITAGNRSFHLIWKLNPNSSCGYVVDWYPTYRVEPCALQWKRFSSQVSKANIDSGQS